MGTVRKSHLTAKQGVILMDGFNFAERVDRKPSKIAKAVINLDSLGQLIAGLTAHFRGGIVASTLTAKCLRCGKEYDGMEVKGAGILRITGNGDDITNRVLTLAKGSCACGATSLEFTWNGTQVTTETSRSKRWWELWK